MAILQVNRRTPNVPDSLNKWYAGQIAGVFEDTKVFTFAESPEGGTFFLIYVTDKTKAEADEYMAEWHHIPVVTQVSNQGNRRLIQVTSSAVSVSGKNAFTQAGVEALFARLAQYPTANPVYNSHGNNFFRFHVTVPMNARDTLLEIINGAVEEMQYARRRWAVTPAGMTYLENNGGTVSGTAAQVAQYLRDGLLD